MAGMPTIAKAARENKVVRINYRKASGDTQIYNLEPYSIRGGKYLFGYDQDEGQIKKFIIRNILSAKATTTEFEPQWEVEF